MQSFNKAVASNRWPVARPAALRGLGRTGEGTDATPLDSQLAGASACCVCVLFVINIIAAPRTIAAGATLPEAEATSYGVVLNELGTPPGMPARASAAGAFFIHSGRTYFMSVGGSTASSTSDEIWVYSYSESKTWSLAPVTTMWPISGTKCAFDSRSGGTSFIYCAGGTYSVAYGQTNFWRIPSALDRWPEVLPSMPTTTGISQRTGHCLAVFNGSVWVAAGFENGGRLNDLLRCV
eukprot:tig00000204_g17699.t1